MSIRDDFSFILSNYLTAKKESGKLVIRRQVARAMFNKKAYPKGSSNIW